MHAAATPDDTRGLTLILEHCARLNGMEHGHPTALLRLRQAIGDELARLLVSALTGDHRARPRPV